MAAIDFVGKAIQKVFGSRNDRLIRRYRDAAKRIEPFELELRGDFDERFESQADPLRARGLEPDELESELQKIRVELAADLRTRTQALRDRLTAGETQQEILAETFAVLREASRRAQAHRHFPCQLIGGMVLFDRCVAEMKTGEGKTIVCHLPCFLNILAGKKVHVVTVNDYLVKRDAEFARPIFELLGSTVGYIQAQVDSGGREGIRQDQYACDITYGTNSEFGFDFLRDNMKLRLQAQVQGRLDYVIVDEVDSILIDEARTPLIISGPAEDDISRYRWANDIALTLVRQQIVLNRKTQERVAAWKDNPPEHLAALQHFEGGFKRAAVDPYMLTDEEAEAIQHTQLFVVQRDRKAAHLTHDGVAVAQDEAGVGSFYVGANMEKPHLIENGLRAHVVYERDKEYVVQNREVIIVDEFTGRLMVGRQWSDGLHQAIEAKENVPIKEESQTMATITIQNYFKLYGQIAGMTGTAMTEAEEFMKIYHLEVIAIPTNRPVNRAEHNDRIYRTVADKYEAIVEEIRDVHRRGRPADPFVMADLLRNLRNLEKKRGEPIDYLDDALSQFDGAENGDREVMQVMGEAYDRAMGDLAVGRPILVGTTSVENSEKLSQLLDKRYGIEHEVLNAKQHQREADIVAKAGHRHLPAKGKDKTPRGNVTIATNMAGRGTDIKLELTVVYPTCIGDLGPGDDNPKRKWHEPGVTGTKCCIYCPDYDAATNCAHCWKPKIDPRFPELGRKICAKNPPCGLHIVGTERHESRRIDNQLRGRSGRQGDPGSSRFFLSLGDDLLKLFMPDWMLKMMEKLGFSEGVSLEDKRLTRGIERAQKKVEERNFSTRKHLLEWDEPMDFQRKGFYGKRQQVLEGRNLRDVIHQMIDESSDEAATSYLAEDFGARQIAEYCRKNFDANLDAKRIVGMDLDELDPLVRARARDEARDSIRTSLGEYVDPDLPPADWDLGGLLAIAQRAWSVSVSQNQLRKLSPDEIEETLVAAADKHIEELDLTPLSIYLDPLLGRARFVDWLRARYEIELSIEDIRDTPQNEIVALISERIRDQYVNREIEVPVEWVLRRAFGDGNTDSAYAAENVAHWVNTRYNLNWDPEHVRGKALPELHKELVDITRDFTLNGRLTTEIDDAIANHDGLSLAEWAKQRFGRALPADATTRDEGPTRDELLEAGQRLLRAEVTELERFVLLNVYDRAWKDHLREMDHLKHAIMQRPLGGDQTHPQSQYAIEGREFYDEMWLNIRERVTDSIFKVRLAGAEGDGPPAAAAMARMTSRHADSTGTGFSGAAATQQQDGLGPQGEAAKPQTIRREKPKVGRNEPCPCGSGKKYKNCHGKR